MKVFTFLVSALHLLSAACSDPAPPNGSDDVVSIRILVSDSTVPVGGSRRLLAEGLDLNGEAVSGVSFSWSSSDQDVATVDTAGRVQGLSAGLVEITAQIDDVAASVEMTVVTLTPPPAGSPDPRLLPELETQPPEDGFPYGRDLSWGDSYVDPTSGVRVWRLTDETVGEGRNVVPAYASGPNQISLPRDDGTRHVVLTRGDGAHMIVEWHPETGVVRPQVIDPGGELRFSFSSVPETAGRAYYLSGGDGDLFQYDVDTGASEHLAGFGEGRHVWLQHDAQDEWFAMMRPRGVGAVAWNRLTGETYTVDEDELDGSLDDIRIDRDGGWLYLAVDQEQPHGGSGTDLVVLNLETGEITDPQVRNTHSDALRGYLVSHNSTRDVGPENFYFDPSAGSLTYTNQMTYAIAGHYAGQWVRGNDPGTLQWALFSGWSSTPGRFIDNAIVIFRIDGSDVRFLVHHDSSGQDYLAQPHATISPDGAVVVWGSDMGGSGRVDSFLAQLPGAS